MDSNGRLPETLTEAIRFFTDPDVCLAFVAKLRWSNGITCPRVRLRASLVPLHPPRSGSARVARSSSRSRSGPSSRTRRIGLDKWLPALWMVVNCKNGDLLL